MPNKYKKNIFQNKGFSNSFDWELLANNVNNILDKSIIIKDEEHVKAGICFYEEKKLFIKKYISRNLLNDVRNIFKTSRALKNCHISKILENSKVNYPKVYGYIEYKNFLSGNYTYLIMEAVDNFATNELYQDYIYDNKENLTVFIQKVVEQIRLMHEKNILHNDCKRSNFYLSGDKTNYVAGVLDFDGAVICKKITDKQKARDVSRFIAAVIEDFNRPEFKKLIDSTALLKLILDFYNKKQTNHYLAEAIKKRLDYHLKRKKLNHGKPGNNGNRN